ncbi:HTH domain-containing protein [Parapedobacter tibetensis]|uniref:HTH domain-containing protein n=1 Tax=Parapedobacter tibetensis TaxID=2972951 RepID=UPI00356B6D01
MDYLTYSIRLDYLLELINKRRLHSPKEIAEKFNCTEKTVRNMINVLRKKGHKIEYCNQNRKYLLKSE